MKVEISSLSGFERSLIYQSADKQRIIDAHLHLAYRYGIKDLYLEKVGKGEKMFLECDLGANSRARIGPIGAFETEYMAMWLNEQISEYVFQGTMGRAFPVDDFESQERLVAEMIGGFKDNHLVVSFENNRSGDWQPYAGVTAYVGESTSNLWKTVTDKSSSLSTFWALDHRLQIPEDDIFSFSECQILEMSRLWKRKSDLLGVLEVTLNDIGWQSMAFLSLGIEQAVLSGYYGDDVAWVLYDTSRRIQESLSKHFGMREVIGETDLRPSKAVLESILAYHYGGDDWGGYAGKIIVGKASVGEYVFAAKKYLKKKNIFTNKNIKKR